MLAPWAKGLRYSGFRRLGRRDIEFRRVHRGERDVSRVDRHHYGLIERGRLWVLPTVEGTVKGNDRTLTLHRGVTHLELRRRLRDGAGGKDLRVWELRVEANRAAMDDSCGSGKAKDIKGPKPLGAHAEAAHMQIMKGGPRIPTKVSIVVMKVGEKEAVEVGEVVVDPLLTSHDVVGEVARQTLQRVDVAR